MKELLNECKLCPRNCLINRNCGEVGYCNAGNEITIAKYYLHKWEEPCITGKYGSGTVFFSGCNLRCVYCQNQKIAAGRTGRVLTVRELARFRGMFGRMSHQYQELRLQ